MLEYVKVCPKCGHSNPESAGELCVCGEFLGPVPLVRASEVSEKQQRASVQEPYVHASPSGGQTESVHGSKNDVPPISKTKRLEGESVLYLELPGLPKIYEIRHGFILGRTHQTNYANVQIDENIPGANYIHRQHCSFDFINGQWFVMAITNESFTNPTYVNQFMVQPGQRRPINNGDKLTLSKVTFNVRIISA